VNGSRCLSTSFSCYLAGLLDFEASFFFGTGSYSIVLEDLFLISSSFIWSSIQSLSSLSWAGLSIIANVFFLDLTCLALSTSALFYLSICCCYFLEISSLCYLKVSSSYLIWYSFLSYFSISSSFLCLSFNLLLSIYSWRIAFLSTTGSATSSSSYSWIFLFPFFLELTGSVKSMRSLLIPF